MNWFEALILGIIQGLTEFLPVSSSGHLELGKVILDIENKENVTFAIVVHGATVLSTIVVFRKDLLYIFKELFTSRWNDSKAFVFKIIISMIPVMILGLFFKDQIESLFVGNVFFVGVMLLFTAALLIFSHFAKDKKKPISFGGSFIIGVAQALATIPGISRSGATISTGLLLGNRREEVAKFSFLMVLVPIIGANFLDLKDVDFNAVDALPLFVLIIGFIAAFFSGLIACKWMISLVKRSKIIYFGYYCLLVGLVAIVYSLLT